MSTTSIPEPPQSAEAVDYPAMTGAKIFVTLVFMVLGAAFVAETGLLIAEFRSFDWTALLLLHSHLFVFFQTFGILALVAFHLPATVFTHMYWTYIPHGRIRFLIGTIVVVIASVVLSFSVIVSYPGELWQIAPAVLQADKPEPAVCDESRQSCQRVALEDGMKDLRAAAQQRFGVSKFARACKLDPLLEVPADYQVKRHCFAANAMLTAPDCCRVQEMYRTHAQKLTTSNAMVSRAALIDEFVLPLKTFFVIVVFVIGVLLVVWRKLLEEKYAAIAPAIERALLIGAAAMIPWPFMDYAYAQAMETLTGHATNTPQIRLSLVVVPWALLLLVFFLARMGRKIERMGQLAGAVASTIAVLRYEQLNDVAVRFLGVGAPWWMLIVVTLPMLVGMLMLRWPRHLQRAINGVVGRHPDVGKGPPPGFKT